MRIGITGHQNLKKYNYTRWTYRNLEIAIEKYELSNGFTLLARGTDQLFARILQKRKIPYTVIIPSYNYETTFNAQNKISYNFYLENAERIIAINKMKPTKLAFREAGYKLVELSDAIIAVWSENNKYQIGSTGDIFNYADSIKKKIIHLNPYKKIVKEMNFEEL